MNESMYRIEIEMVTRTMAIIVAAISRNDARLRAIDIVNRMYHLPVAHWDEGGCGRWVRGRLAGLHPDTPVEDRSDGFFCTIGWPERFGELQ